MIASGSVTAGRIASRLGRQVSNLAPALARLVDAGFVPRHEDPIRKQGPTYALADPYLHPNPGRTQTCPPWTPSKTRSSRSSPKFPQLQ